MHGNAVPDFSSDHRLFHKLPYLPPLHLYVMIEGEILLALSNERDLRIIVGHLVLCGLCFEVPPLTCTANRFDQEIKTTEELSRSVDDQRGSLGHTVDQNVFTVPEKDASFF